MDSHAAAGSDWRTRLSPYWRLIRGDRPVGTLLLLWPTAWALWLAAGGFPPVGTLAIFLAGVWLTRSAGCVINDYADRWLDPQVARTKSRPLATGELQPRDALLTFVLMMAVAFGLVLLTNRLTVYLSVVGVLLAASYPFLKRYTYLPQLYLGLAFGWGIPMAFAAVQGKVPELAWLLFLGNLLWTTGYDTWYAMVDREDDLRAGSRSTAILFGDMDLVALGVLYLGFVATMFLLAGRAGLGFLYLAALAVSAGFIAWQFLVARDRRPENCFRAFLANQWVGLVLFLGIALDLASY
jgi:4-hydroxybenzoate polyprenyltransferase